MVMMMILTSNLITRSLHSSRYHSSHIQITCTYPYPHQHPDYFQSLLRQVDQSAEFVFISTTNNDLFMPYIDKLMTRKGKTMVLLPEGKERENDFFIRTHVKGNYHILQQ